MTLTIIPREVWGAAEPTIRRPLVTPVTNIAEDYWCPYTLNKKRFWTTCLNQEDCMQRCRDIQQMSFKRRLTDLPYNFLIGGDGNVYEGRGWTTLLSEDFRWDGIVIGHIGKYRFENPPPDYMREVFYQLVEFGKKRFYIKQEPAIISLNQEKDHMGDDD